MGIRRTSEPETGTMMDSATLIRLPTSKMLSEKLESGEKIDEKTIIMDEKGFDATTITQDDVDQFGILMMGCARSRNRS